MILLIIVRLKMESERDKECDFKKMKSRGKEKKLIFMIRGMF